MKLRGTEKHTYRDGRPHLFYSCLLWPICESTIGSDPRGNPQGRPADAETRALRVRCHQEFDQIWQSRRSPDYLSTGMTRKQAYRLLQKIMGMTETEAHFGNFTKEQCEEFLRRWRRWRDET